MSMNVSSLTSDSFSTLFSSLAKPTGVNALTSLMSDYSSIKDGSYGKLLRAYYSMDGEDTKTQPKDIKDYKEVKRTDYEKKANAEYEKKQKERLGKTTDDASLNGSATKAEKTEASAAAELADSTAKLMDQDTYKEIETKDASGNTTKAVDRDKLESAVKDFVSDYNDMVDTGASSSTSGVKTGVKNLGSNTRAASRDLEKIGISVDAKSGHLSVDADKLKEATADEIKRVFSGTNSYGKNVSGNVSSISYYANAQASGNGGYDSSGKYNSGTLSNFSDLI